MDSHYPIGEAVWAAAAIVLLFAFGDILVLLALVVAIAGMAAAWVAYRQVQHDAAGDHHLAPVTRLRPASTGRREPKSAPAQAPWRGPSAA